MSKKLDTWMPLYIGDYLADTSRLSTEQHGAYLLILMDYWRNGPPLDDDEELASITKLGLQQWRKHAPKLRQFFASVDGRLMQKRADGEREKVGLTSNKRSESGKAGAAKRWGKTDGEPIANSMANAMAGPMANGMANAKQNDASAGTQSQSQPQKTFDTQPATDAGRVSKILRQAGIADAHPGHEGLRALVEARVTDDEWLAAAETARGKGKGLLYVIGVVKGRRADAAEIDLAPPVKAPSNTVPSNDAARTAAMLSQQSGRAPDRPGPEALAALREAKKRIATT